jgi:hypothetical protein
MATDKYPNQNVVMPMKQSRIDAARARLDPGRVGTPTPPPMDGKGSRREVRPGEWIDDRKFQIGGPSSPSKDTPPELPKKSGKAVPSSYDPNKVYSVKINKSVVFAGRPLTPGKDYTMAGYACTEISAAIVDAVELGDTPVDPDSAPS